MGETTTQLLRSICLPRLFIYCRTQENVESNIKYYNLQSADDFWFRLLGGVATRIRGVVECSSPYVSLASWLLFRLSSTYMSLFVSVKDSSVISQENKWKEQFQSTLLVWGQIRTNERPDDILYRKCIVITSFLSFPVGRLHMTCRKANGTEVK